MLERTEERLRLRVPASSKPSNILKLLESEGCAEPLARGLTVTRERCWAQAGLHAGLHPAMDGGAASTAAGAAAGPVSYFELDFPS